MRRTQPATRSTAATLSAVSAERLIQEGEKGQSPNRAAAIVAGDKPYPWGVAMPFETVALDIASSVFPSEAELATVQSPELERLVEAGVSGVAALLGKPAERIRARLGKTVGIKDFGGADCEDLREAARTLRQWFNDPSSFAPPQRPRMQRPSGMGRLPVPSSIKQASVGMLCGLCADPVKAGEIIGRTRAPKDKRLYKAMGWLCRHCLYERRESPRRRDVLLRVFHHLFAGSAVDLNGYECAVLRTWLLEDADISQAASWQHDPLTATLVRLQTSEEEGKAGTWLAFPTACTIIAVLRERSASLACSPADTDLLDAVAQHLHEWETNPQKVEHRRYGSGPAFRAQVLAVTDCPSVLSERGGPFDLHHAPAPVSEQGEGQDGETEA